MNVRQHRLSLIGFGVVLGLFVLYVLGISVRQHAGIRVDIRNLSGKELRDVSVKVEDRGNHYRVADLGPGDKEHVFVEPITESHIAVEFLRANGGRQSKVVIGYAEASYCGSVVLTVLPDDSLDSTDLHFDCSTSWFGFI